MKKLAQNTFIPSSGLMVLFAQCVDANIAIPSTDMAATSVPVAVTKLLLLPTP